MAAICDPCGWSGSALAVRDGGRCPECGEPIRYDRAALPQRRQIGSIHEFNSRARVALMALPVLNPFIEAIVTKLETGRALTEREQQALFNTVNSRHRQISDSELTEYAVRHARGAD